jgi:hypothetical protein
MAGAAISRRGSLGVEDFLDSRNAIFVSDARFAAQKPSTHPGRLLCAAGSVAPMKKMCSIGFLASLLAVVCVPSARAIDISPKKMLIENIPKELVSLTSTDPALERSGAVDPDLLGASIHLYSATDDMCVQLEPGANWRNGKSKSTYRNKVTKTIAELGNHMLRFKMTSGITFTTTDQDGQDAVNAQVKFGAGPKYCMRCSGQGMAGFFGIRVDNDRKFDAIRCFPDACAPEPSICNPPLYGSPSRAFLSPTTSLLD